MAQVRNEVRKQELLIMKSCRKYAFIAGVFCISASALAGPDEDYQAGVKSFRDGDVVGAMTPLRSASLAGHAKAQALLAEILDRTDFDEDAIALYRLSAAQGEPDGMFGLGVMTASGEGTRKDVLAGRDWILKAADKGLVLAVNVVAQAYLKGELGYGDADRNTPEALLWIKRAAANEYLPAIDALAAAYATGSGLAVEADRAQAESYQAQANRIRNIDPNKGKKKQRRM
jgi:TPR repeat protein